MIESTNYAGELEEYPVEFESLDRDEIAAKRQRISLVGVYVLRLNLLYSIRLRGELALVELGRPTGGAMDGAGEPLDVDHLG